MGVFGEAIYGHAGQYKARIYNAEYIRTEDGRGKLVRARGLSEQDAVNEIFSKAKIGPQNDSVLVLALDTEIRGYSWAVRTARQTNSAVSNGYSHAVHSETSLSALYNIDRFIYFPFIPNGDYCVSLIQNEASFNAAARWNINMQSVAAVAEASYKKLGQPLGIPVELLKRLTSYIVSQVSVNAKQFLYIRVPDQAPYEAYCQQAIHDILTMIPAGLRAGISISTNPTPQDEKQYGIIFQRASYPAKHETDINLHVNAQYPFLKLVYLNPAVQRLLEQIAEYPELTDKCYRTMEKEVFGDAIPKSFDAYANYYGISNIQTDKGRASYLEECSRLIASTKEPSLQKILNRIILDEYRNSADLEAAIHRDPLFGHVRTFSSLSGYLKERAPIFSFLEQNGIKYSAMFIYGHLKDIAFGGGVQNAIEFYNKVVNELKDLSGLSDAERRKLLLDSHDSAWNYFHNMRSKPESGWNDLTAMNKYASICNLDQRSNTSFTPPVSEVNWYNHQSRKALLSQFKEVPSGETASRVFGIPDYDIESGQETCLTVESEELVKVILQKMRSMTETRQDPNTAGINIRQLTDWKMAVDTFFDRWSKFFSEAYKQQVPETFQREFECALYHEALAYTDTSNTGGNDLSSIMSLLWEKMPQQAGDCIRDIEVQLARYIKDGSMSEEKRFSVYQAASGWEIVPELQKAFSDWVLSELRMDVLSEDKLRQLYGVVRNPDPQLQMAYRQWTERTSKIKEVVEKMNVSRTLVKYLNTILYANGTVLEDDIGPARKRMWSQLPIQERTISAFTASVSYVLGNSAAVVLQSDRYYSKAAILRREAEILINKYNMGIYLDPRRSISELYEEANQFQMWSDASQLALYTTKRLDMDGVGIVTDSDGTDVFYRNVNTDHFKNLVQRLLWILDEADYSQPRGARVDLASIANDFSNRSGQNILNILDAAGVIAGNAELAARLPKMGYNPSTRRIGNDGSMGLIGSVLTVAGVAILALIAGILIGKFLLGGKKEPEATVVSGETGVTTEEEEKTEGETVEETPLQEEQTGEATGVLPPFEYQGDDNFAKVLAYSKDNTTLTCENGQVLIPGIVSFRIDDDKERFAVQFFKVVLGEDSSVLTITEVSNPIVTRIKENEAEVIATEDVPDDNTKNRIKENMLENMNSYMQSCEKNGIIIKTVSDTTVDPSQSYKMDQNEKLTQQILDQKDTEETKTQDASAQNGADDVNKEDLSNDNEQH